ncbi:hypothetical protein FALB51S_02298 [Frigidibacter albus]
MAERPPTRQSGSARSTATLLLWAVLLVPILLLTSVPTSNAGQALLSIVAVLLVVLLKPFSEQTAARFALLAIASVIVLRYLIWRLLETLPPAAPTLSFAIAVLLFTVEPVFEPDVLPERLHQRRPDHPQDAAAGLAARSADGGYPRAVL